jgi:uncharacterized membrane protein YvlD (DUF360 family)
MTRQEGSANSEGLSLQTLVIAAVASGIAAVVVSHFWRSGTVPAAAMTPVIVSIVKELLHRPMQSDVVRRSASMVSEVATARRAVAGVAAARTESARRHTPGTGSVPPPRRSDANGANGAEGEVTPGDVLLTHPRRTYGRSRRLRPLHLKLAIVTGLLAFVVATVVLTVPELVFGGAVASHHRTTFFGGGSKSQSGQTTDQQQNGGSSQDQQDQGGSDQQPSGSGSEPSQQPNDQSQQKQPPQDQQSQPQEQPPSSGGGAPAPSAPKPSSPSP